MRKTYSILVATVLMVGLLASLNPTSATSAALVPTFASVSVGSNHTCAIRSDQSAWCWGKNSYGQLGDKTTKDRLTPTQVFGGDTWLSISAGSQFTCGVTTGHLAKCWGLIRYDIKGEVGNTYVTQPSALLLGKDTAQISTGGSFACLIYLDGSGRCVGSSKVALLGGSTRDPRPIRSVTSGRWNLIAAGPGHACGIRANLVAWCWGLTETGAQGTGDSRPHQLPTPLAGIAGAWRELSAGGQHSCGIKPGGALFCWGSNQEGQLGIGSLLPSQLTFLTAVPVISDRADWLTISAGTDHTCGLRRDHTAWCWGNNTDGPVGRPEQLGRIVRVPEQVVGNASWQSISAGGQNTCGIQTDGTLWCWGSNREGELGLGNLTPQATPRLIVRPAL